MSRRTVLVQGLRGLAAVSVAGAFGSAVSACDSGQSSSSTARIKPGGTLLAGVASDPDSLDPHKSSLAVSATVYAGIFSRLVDLQKDGAFTPSLAKSWTTPDTSTYVFTLRDDVTFHNGERLTAADVVFTFDRIRDKKVGATYATDFDAVESVEATGDHEVTFRLSRPFAPFLANLANRGHVMNKVAVDTSDPTLNPVGTGPFKFDAWSQGQELRLTRNDSYFASGRPYLDGVTFKYRPNDQSRVTALRANELGWVDGLSPQSVAEVQGDDTLSYVSSSTTGKPEFIFINPSSPKLQNKALRQAICWAIDRNEIAKTGFFGAVEPGSLEVGSTSPWYSASDDPYASGPDPDKVRALLAEAGIPDGGITLSFPAWTSGPDAARTAQIIQQQLKPYNIEVDIQTMEISVWIKRLFDRDYDLTLAFQEQIVDPDNFWSLIFTTNGGQNVTGYGNSAVDKLVEQAASTSDEAERRALYRQVRTTVLDDAPVLFTAYVPLNYAARAEVLGVAITPCQDPQFANIGMA